MKIEILNPDVLENLYHNHGVFACECYGTPEKYAEKVGESCQESNHMSGSRCEYIKFRISDVDRGSAEQCLRHEIGTFVPFEELDNYSFSDYAEKAINVNSGSIVKNMASFRYIDKDGFNYVIPSNIAKLKNIRQEYEKVMKTINDGRANIKKLLEEAGVDPNRATEDANFLLPRATTTSFTIGFTPEALIHFCHKRLCSRSQEFIRKMATEIKNEVRKIHPKFAEELVPHCEHLLWCPEKSTCGKTPTKEMLKRNLNLKN